ncbi:MAG: DUF6624 domain-containing protein [Acidimicrobiales bacterium]
MGCADGNDPGFAAFAAGLQSLAAADRAAAGAVTNLILQDDRARTQIERRLGWGPYLRPGRYRTLQMLDWPGGPPAVQEAMSAWSRLPTRLRELVASHGWPPRTAVDEPTEALLWILLLHADRDPTTQKQLLDAAAALVPSGGVDAHRFAVAADHVAAVESGEQLYGTMTEEPGSDAMLLPLRDPDGVDDRRQALGLPPLDADVREGINYATVAAELAHHAGLGS